MIKACWPISVILAFVVLGSACVHPRVDEPLPFEPAQQMGELKKLWAMRVPGLITEFSIAEKDGSVFLATIPDPDRPGDSSQRYCARRLDGLTGKILWSYCPDSQIKSLSVAPDASLVVLATRDGELEAIDQRGKLRWNRDGECRPWVSAARQILCFHDDDPEPGVAFEVMSEEGKDLFTVAEKQDVLSYQLSLDDTALVLGLSGSTVRIFDRPYKSGVRVPVKGEVVDVAASSGTSPVIAVLVQGEPGPQKMIWLDARGGVLGSVDLTSRFEQLAISENGAAAAAYRNGAEGQEFAFFERLNGKLTQKWRRLYPRQADYSSVLFFADGELVVGIETGRQNARQHHLAAFDSTGKLRWDLPIAADEGAYLYGQGYSATRRTLVFATDDSQVSAYSITR